MGHVLKRETHHGGLECKRKKKDEVERSREAKKMERKYLALGLRDLQDEKGELRQSCRRQLGKGELQGLIEVDFAMEFEIAQLTGRY